MPLYVENDEAEGILRAGGRAPYGADEWQLVQTHLIHRSGEIEELWRPSQDSGAEDPAALIAALDGAIAAHGLEAGPRLIDYRNPLADEVGEGGLVLRAVLRYFEQDSMPYGHAYTVDSIALSAEELAQLRPPSPEATAWSVSEPLARAVMLHLRPPLDQAEDRDADALAQVTGASLDAAVIARGAEEVVVGLRGTLAMRCPGPPPPLPDSPRDWVDLQAVDIAMDGFLRLDAETGAVRDAGLVADRAALVTPGGQTIRYYGVARAITPSGEPY